MANVVRFVLSTARDVHVPGVGQFHNGVLDIDANNMAALTRARYLLQPYQAVELGVVHSAAPPPELPPDILDVEILPDPYPQYLDEVEADAKYVPFWKPGKFVAAGAIRMAADGTTIRRNTSGTTRVSFDETEASLWTVVSSGGDGVGLSEDDVAAGLAESGNPIGDAARAALETRVPRTGATTGQVPVLQGDGSLAFGTVSAGDGSVSDATDSAKGVVRLAGDLGGTADAPTVPGLAGKAATGHTHTSTSISDFSEAAQDAAAAMFRAGTNVTFTYDAADSITIDVTGLAAVATSGAYSDLTGRPTIPAATTSASDLTSGTLAPARIADGSVPFTKMTGQISDAQIPAGIARDSEVAAAVAALVASAPSTLDTLDELAAALGDDANFAASTATAIANAKAAAEGVKMHDGTTGGGTRPAGYARVRWVGGTARPTNMVTGDIWEHTA